MSSLVMGIWASRLIPRGHHDVALYIQGRKQGSWWQKGPSLYQGGEKNVSQKPISRLVFHSRCPLRDHGLSLAAGGVVKISIFSREIELSTINLDL